MDQQRLNDFRRRLQRGDAMRVINGEVTLASDPPKNNSSPAATNPGGVRVKPHEWGAHPAPCGTGGGR